MATFHANSAAPAGGDGSQALPYNAIPGNAFGSGHEWILAPGSVFDLAGAQLTSGNSALVRRGAGEGLNPYFTGTNATLFSCATATGLVEFDGVGLVRSGAQGGTGVNCQQMSGGSAEFRFRNGMIAGFNTLIQATRTRKLVTEKTDFLGSVTTYAIRGVAQLGNNCDGWRIKGNTFDCGTDLELYVSDAAGTAGSFIGLVVEDNRMVFNGGGYGGTSMLLRGQMNATDYSATASITGGNTLVRDPGSPVWPAAWTAGTVLFLAGWADVANFGTVTVVSGGGTRNVVVTNLGATLVNESAGIGKGCAVFDPARAFVNPMIRRNRIGKRGYTPTFFDNFIDGLVEANTVEDTFAVASSVAAAFEHFGCQRTTSRYNQVLGMTGVVSVDMMGLFWDGACVDCKGYGNYYRGIRPTAANSNAGAGMASYFSLNCEHTMSLVEDCLRGWWAGGKGTRGLADNNTIAGCTTGVQIDGSPVAGAMKLRNNVLAACGTGIRDSSSATVANNAWWGNGVDNHFGTLASKDAAAITVDPQLTAQYMPRLGSPLLGGGSGTTYTRDRHRRQVRGIVGCHGAAQYRRVPAGAS